MTLDELLVDAETKLSGLLGGATALSNPSLYASDPFVQAILVALGGQADLDAKIESKFNNYDINTVSCNCIDTVASLVGETRHVNKPTTVSIVISGVNDITLPANSQFTDSTGNTWILDSETTIENGIGFGEAISSSSGEFNVVAGDLSLTNSVSGINIATNSGVIDLGFVEESCEQFRERLLTQNILAPETESSVLKLLEKEADFATFISDYPDCDGTGCLGKGFVLRGGDETTLANIIRDYSPLNYMTLAGNTSIPFDNCEDVKFIRPCGVGIQIKYTASKEITDEEFSEIICENNSSLYNKNFSSIDCLTSISFRVVRSSSPALECGDPETADGCGETVDLLSEDCPCVQEECSSPDFKPCAVLNSWEYPVFLSAEYIDGDC
ncbi:baseplate J/gp47 family protein [bacterium]|nr:baseplate J/gp47 family protein [bacterium]